MAGGSASFVSAQFVFGLRGHVCLANVCLCFPDRARSPDAIFSPRSLARPRRRRFLLRHRRLRCCVSELTWTPRTRPGCSTSCQDASKAKRGRALGLAVRPPFDGFVSATRGRPKARTPPRSRPLSLATMIARCEDAALGTPARPWGRRFERCHDVKASAGRR